MAAADVLAAEFIAGAEGVFAAAAAGQIKAVYFLKRFEGRSMTKMVQEAVDQFLEPHGGAKALIERGIAEFGDPGEEARLRRGAR